MKWGVRNNESSNGLPSAPKIGANRKAAHADAVKELNSSILPKINSDPRFAGKNLRNNPDLAVEYANEVQKSFKKSYSEALERRQAPDKARNSKYLATLTYSALATLALLTLAGGSSSVRHDDLAEGESIYFESPINEFGFMSEFKEVSSPAPSHDLMHYGVKGMKWGVRNDRPAELQGIRKSTVKAAAKDAREFTKAKMFYGEGAGNRRKLIKARVESRSKDEDYKKAFDYFTQNTDLGKRASQARRERGRKDATNTTKRTVRGVKNTLLGNPKYATAGAIALAVGGREIHRRGLDRKALDFAASKFKHDDLLHYGVKGMKWGVRNDKGHEGKRTKTKKIDKLDRKFERNSQSDKTTIAIYNGAARKTNTVDIPRINDRYKEVDLSKPSSKRDRYDAEIQKAFTKNLDQSARDLGTNASGTKEYRVHTSPDGSWEVYTESIAHSDMDTPLFVVRPKRDSTGRIVDLEMEEDTTSTDLQHYGIKGMKWGVRNDAPASSGSSASGGDSAGALYKQLRERIRTEGPDGLSNDELNFVNNRADAIRRLEKLNEKNPNWGQELLVKTAKRVVESTVQDVTKHVTKKYVSGPLNDRIDSFVDARRAIDLGSDVLDNYVI